jgi:peptidoglycan hydrolase FlgJ
MNGLPAVSSVPLGGQPPVSDDTRLKKTALQMEGLFVQRLFVAMRETVPDDGVAAPSSAESTFTSMLDEKMAEQVPSQWNGEHSLAQALYHQLRQRLSPAASATATAVPSTDVPR